MSKSPVAGKRGPRLSIAGSAEPVSKASRSEQPSAIAAGSPNLLTLSQSQPMAHSTEHLDDEDDLPITVQVARTRERLVAALPVPEPQLKAAMAEILRSVMLVPDATINKRDLRHKLEEALSTKLGDHKDILQLLATECTDELEQELGGSPKKRAPKKPRTKQPVAAGDGELTKSPPATSPVPKPPGAGNAVVPVTAPAAVPSADSATSAVRAKPGRKPSAKKSALPTAAQVAAEPEKAVQAHVDIVPAIAPGAVAEKHVESKAASARAPNAAAVVPVADVTHAAAPTPAVALALEHANVALRDSSVLQLIDAGLACLTAARRLMAGSSA